MSNIFEDSESLGKSIGKKWSNIWTFFFGSGLKSPRKKKFFFWLILPWSTLLWHRCYYPHPSRDALSPVCGIFKQQIVKYSYFNTFFCAPDCPSCLVSSCSSCHIDVHGHVKKIDGVDSVLKILNERITQWLNLSINQWQSY